MSDYEPKWEFDAPQKVDFSSLNKEEKHLDEWFGKFWMAIERW
jgi:hypothetical protein